MDDYPTEQQLVKIETWPANDLEGLMGFIQPLWAYADCGYWSQLDGVYRISTAGWSGNEEIISSLQQNHIWWMMFWYQSRRGGHYIFANHSCLEIE